MGGSFSAGSNLSINVRNTSVNSGDSSNYVGRVNGDQYLFSQNCSLSEGASIVAYNSGTVVGSQIVFSQGFDVISGKVNIQAINSGTIGSFGIDIQGSNEGGNADILLTDSSLYIETTLPTFSISSLTGDSTSFVRSKPTLVINTDASTNIEFSGSIQDFPSLVSSLTKTGAGVQKLSGTNTFTGLTSIDEGTLIVSGSLAGAVDVIGSGVLKGSGTIAGNVTNAAKISPGESIGTITFSSDFINNGGEYDVEVNGADQSDLINVGGNATLNGGLVAVSSSDGTYDFQHDYAIVAVAGNITGKFSEVSAVSPLIKPVLSYDSHHVFLKLYSNIISAAQSSNERAVARQLDGIVDPTAEQSLLLSQIVNLTPIAATEALFGLSGYQHTSDFLATEVIQRQFIRRLYDPLRNIVSLGEISCGLGCSACEEPIQGWFEIGNSYLSAKGNDNAAGFNMDGYNIVAGVQTAYGEEWTLGIAGEYERDEIRFNEGGGKEKSNNWLVGLYCLYRPCGYYSLVDLVYGYSNNQLHRSIDVGTSHYVAKSSPATYQYTFYGEVGADYSFCNTLIQPFFGLEAGTFHRRRVKESHANGWNLIVKEKHQSLASTRLGVHLTSGISCWEDLCISLDVAWDMLLNKVKNRVRERYIDFGSSFDVKGIALQQNSIDYTLTFSSMVDDNCQIFVEGSGESWKDLNQFSLIGGVNFNW